MRYRWKVTKPEGGTKYHVKKFTLAHDRPVGSVASFNGELTARDYANRQAAKDVAGKRGFV